MPITLHNSLTRQTEPFEPFELNRVRMYSCGPTVYDFPHIGNWRANVFVDLLKRYLVYRGLDVFHVMNITDVDDKTIAGAAREGVSLAEYTAPYIEAFFEEVDALRIRRADEYPRATDHIHEMIDLVRMLGEKELTYESDGSIYYAVDRFPEYGGLSGVDMTGLKPGARVDADLYEKEEVRDFVLWKGRKSEDGDVFWESPFGEGRPGWHLECSAMSDHYLTAPFDIHTGGIDLLFPHHENEIAQSKGATGLDLARFWVHNEHLMVDGRKMSKSLGNYHTLGNLLEAGHDAVTVRYALLSTHYRQQLNFKPDDLAGAAASVERLRGAARLWRERSQQTDNRETGLEEARQAAERARSDFTAAMDDDLNISAGLSAVFELVRSGNAMLDRGVGADGAIVLLETLTAFDEVLAVMAEEEVVLPDDLNDLVEAREAARKNRDWAEADRLRDLLQQAGIIVEDTPDGPRWKRVGNV
jgi:cysteinyl-tRNA synthetase